MRMKGLILHRFLALVVMLVTPAISFAQEAENGVSFRFGLGPGFGPGYFGDEDTDAKPAFKFQFEELRFGGIGAGGGGDNYGLGFGGSVRFVGERSADDYEELDGLEDVDLSFELGGGLEYSAPGYDVFAKLRYGVIGHESFVAELGSDIYYRPTDQLTFKAGPRILLGDDDYASTYFGVTADESAASSFDVFDARGGIISAGARAEATYAINDDWEVVGTIRYDQLREDAADSPITQSEDQISGSLVLTRQITFGF